MGERVTSFLNKLWFSKVERMLAVLADFVVVFGIILAFQQIYQSKELEKRSIAIEAIKLTRSNEFIKAYNKLISESISADNLNYVLGVYENIAILYAKGVADECIIKENLYSNVQEIIKMLDNNKNYPKEYGKIINNFLKLMDKKSCQ